MAVLQNTHGVPAAFGTNGFAGNGWTDYSRLCAGHVPAVRQVLAGQRLRYRLRYENAVIYFDQGCLLSRIFFKNQLYGMPMFFRAANGSPALRVLPKHQHSFYQEVLTLPKGLLLFYFTLLKESFGGLPLAAYREDEGTGALNPCGLPEVLLPVLQAVGWTTA